MPDISLSDGDDEAQLAVHIRRYRARTGRRITLFFDGGAAYKPGSTHKRGGITTRYAPHGITADTLIINQLRRERNPKEVLVISSDREIQRAARQVQAQVMSSSEFASLLIDLQTMPPTTDDVALSDDEIDAWLSIFGEADE